jgi:FKBP-type peptidyl-prolyl cis-trans isomerase FklB
MKRLSLSTLLIGAVLFFTACNGTTNSQTKSGKVSLKTDADSASYALGVNVASQVKGGIEDMNFDAFIQAVKDVYAASDLQITEVESQMVLQKYFTMNAQKMADKNMKEGLDFLDENKKREGVITTPSGLQYEVVKSAEGPKPKGDDEVEVHYHGTLIDGTVFDSSVDRGEPVSFPLNGVIPGWTEGLQLMPVGSKYKFYIPAELAYGQNPPPGSSIGPNAVLIFEVELLDIVK